MKPYSGRNLPHTKAIFNYRQSRARRVIENTFGIAAARWRVWRRPMECQPNLAVQICKSVVVLHNFCMIEESTYSPPKSIAKEPTDLPTTAGTALRSISHKPRKAKLIAEEFRNRLAYWCITTGQVEWQDRAIGIN